MQCYYQRVEAATVKFRKFGIAPVSFLEEEKDLCVTFHQKIKFSNHVDGNCASANHKLGVIKRTFSTTFFYPEVNPEEAHEYINLSLHVYPRYYPRYKVNSTLDCFIVVKIVPKIWRYGWPP